MSIEIQKAMSAAWEYDHKEVAERGRLDDAYEMGFLAAWNNCQKKVDEMQDAMMAMSDSLGILANEGMSS